MEQTQNKYLTKFIEQYIVEPGLQFNSTKSSGAHVPFIIAAAKRRGLRIEGNPGAYTIVAGRQVVGGTTRMATSLISQVALNVCASKELTKAHFKLGAVPTPEGYRITGELRDAQEFLLRTGGPAVIKPDANRGGTGVTTDLTDESTLAAAIIDARKHSKDGAILIEKMHHGIDIRAYTVGGKVVAATSRIPPFVVGDGVSTIASLVEAKRMQRHTSVYLSKTGGIQVDDSFLSRNGFATISVPSKGEIVLLGLIANVHRGAETVDITADLSEDVRDLAERAARSIPGFGAGGIDIIARSPVDAEGAVALEAEAGANISVHHLPAYGEARDVADSIVDQMLRTSFDPARHHW